MDPQSPNPFPSGVNHGLVSPGTGKRRLIIRDLVAHHGKALIVTVHLFMPGIRDDLRLSGVKALLYDVHARADQNAAVLDAFEKLDAGALVTSASAASKLQFSVPLLMFAECSVGLRSKLYLDIMRRSGARHVHYVNCNFGTEPHSTREFLNVQTALQPLHKMPH
jgi:hypothetical protein